MIQANELRIGNYVYLYNPEAWQEYINEVCTVVGMDLNITKKEKEIWKSSFGSLVLESKNKKQFNQFSEYAKSIPLTEEWLLKFGFLKYKGDNKVFWLNDFEFKNDLKWIFWRGNILKNIKHVHQLQNLYFALTNKELNITL